ncbi:MAG TPA: hypothetical protein VGX92_19850 [Pyrinomonadaceae bacterium]|jgi:hypothetical protein|nr:hypothetical protein [Pyrinomonadaceae bacterium]
MRFKPRFISLLLLTLLLTQGGARAQYLHPKLSNKQSVVRNVVILPPKVEIVKQGVKGTESMVEESEKVSAAISELVAQVLQKKKINVLNTPFANLTGENDAEKKYVLADIQGRYDALLPKLVNKPKDVKKGRFSLGDEVLSLNVDKSADALVFIRGQGTKLTKGKQIFSILNPLSFAFPYVFITIGIVDAHTGEVLAFAKPVAVGDVVGKEQKVLNKPITKSLKKIPEAT